MNIRSATREVVCATFIALLSAGCRQSSAASGTPLPPDAVRELDAVRDATKAAHDEYERLYNSVVFPNDTMKTAAAEWYKAKEYTWQLLQLVQARTRRVGTGASPSDLVYAVAAADGYVDSEPAVFVQTTYYPKLIKNQLTSLAKLATIRQDYEAARLRFAKALLVEEQKLSSRP